MNINWKRRQFETVFNSSIWNVFEPVIVHFVRLFYLHINGKYFLFRLNFLIILNVYKRNIWMRHTIYPLILKQKVYSQGRCYKVWLLTSENTKTPQGLISHRQYRHVWVIGNNLCDIYMKLIRGNFIPFYLT